MTARIHCPLCDWSHEDYGPNPQATDPRALAAVFGHGVFAAHAIASHARKIEERLAAHFKTHRTVEWLRKVTALEHQLRISAGMLSTHPQFADKHPDVALQAIRDAAATDVAMGHGRFTDGRGKDISHLVDQPHQ